MANTVKFDLPESEWERARKELAAQRREIEAKNLMMMQQPLKGEMVSGYFVPPSWSQNLSRAVNSYLGKKEKEKLSKEEKRLAEEENKSLLDTVQQYFAAMTPTPGRPAVPESVMELKNPLEELPRPPMTAGYNTPGAIETKELPPVAPSIESLPRDPVTGEDILLPPRETMLPAAPVPLKARIRAIPTGGGRSSASLPPMVAEAGKIVSPPLAQAIQQRNQTFFDQPNKAEPMPAYDERPRFTQSTSTYVRPGIPAQPPIPADPRKALMIALAAKHPMMQKLGYDQLSDMMAPGEAPGVKEFLKAAQYLEPGSLTALGAPEGFKNLVMRNDLKLVPMGSALASGTDPNAPLSANTKGRVVQETDSRGDKYNVDTWTGMKTKADNAANVNVTSSVQAFEPAMGRKVADLAGSQLEESKKLADSAQKDMQVLNQAEEYFKQGIKTGVLVDPRNFLDKLAVTLGFQSDNPNISNTDLFVRKMRERAAAILASGAYGAGTGISEKDLEEVVKVASGKDMTQDGLAAFMRVAKHSNQVAIKNYEERLKAFERMPGAIPGFADFMGVSPAGAPAAPVQAPSSRESKMQEIERLKREIKELEGR